MIKSILKFFLYLLILITIVVVYLSYFGIETKRFNQLIKDKILDGELDEFLEQSLYKIK